MNRRFKNAWLLLMAMLLTAGAGTAGAQHEGHAAHGAAAADAAASDDADSTQSHTMMGGEGCCMSRDHAMDSDEKSCCMMMGHGETAKAANSDEEADDDEALEAEAAKMDPKGQCCGGMGHGGGHMGHMNQEMDRAGHGGMGHGGVHMGHMNQEGMGMGRGGMGRGGGGHGQMGRGGAHGSGGMRGVMHSAMTLIRFHDSIDREVEEIPGGVKTTTTTNDPQLLEVVRRHPREMQSLYAAGGSVRHWDPLFVELAQHQSKIKMEFRDIENGIEVISTSDDPEVVKLIRAHAEKVNDFVARGFEAYHESTPLP